MMYSDKLAVAVKKSGKVLREFEDKVYVPFGSEYSIFIKNLNSVRASVSIEIDGEDIGDGTQFVVGPNDSIDIERFLKNGNLKKGNKFKFIERTGDVENHRGIGVEDGLIRVEFKFERKPDPIQWTTYSTTRGGCWGDNGNILRSNGIVSSTYTADSSMDAPIATFTAQSMDVSNAVENDVGITAPGSESDQKFQMVSSFPTEAETHVIVLKLLGQTKDNVQVQKAVDVNWKPECVSCGRKNKANAKFCSNCGTALTIVA